MCMDDPLLKFVTFILFAYLSCYNFNQQQKLVIMPILAEISILTLICLLIGLSQTAGIGGGPLINTCLMLMYDSKTSISLTYLFIFGGSLASIWKNYRKGRKEGKQLINIDLIMITLPLMNSGAMLGIMVRNYLSELWLTVFLTILFLYLIRDITKCIVSRRKKMKENQTSNQITAQSTTERDLSQQKPSQCLQRPNEKISCPFKQQCQQSSKQNSQKLDKNYEGQKSFEKQNKIKSLSFFVLFVLFYGITVLLTFVKGGIAHQSIVGLERCSNVGILIVLMFLMFSFIFSLFIASYIAKFRKSMADLSTLQQQQFKLQYKLKSTQIPITKNHMKRYLFCGILAGVVGAALGIGGAPILIPLWLSMKIDPIAASSSTAPLILSSSLISITISGLNNNYQQFSFLSLALYTFLSVISSAVIRGTYFIMLEILSSIADKYKLKDFVIILLLIIMILGLVIFLPFQATKMQNYETFNKIGEFC